jgi:uncharacterized membrane protein YraQ (UPF0718 family)
MNIANIIRKNKLLLVVVFIYFLLFIITPDKGIQSIKNSMYYIIEMLEIIPVIFLLTSLIETWVPKEIIINSFGEKSGVKGSLFSFILGSFSAGPIYAAFPVCKMLLKKGASITNIVIILSSWAVIKVPMLVNEGKFLGTRFMLVRWILTIISILIMSYIVSIFIKKENIPMNVNTNKNMKGNVIVKKEYCVGCGICNRIAPECFNILNGKVELLNKKIEQAHMKNILKAIGKCPVKAIDME